jgi:short-subunit dehydrogenase
MAAPYDPRPVDLQGRRVLVTGASRGIGASLARGFAGAGASVALAARGESALRSLAEEVGGTVHPVDLADPAQVATFLHRVEDEAGPVDVLVNNAGIEITKGIADTSEEELRRLTQVNYLAPAELCRQAIPRMLRRGQGHVVNVSSLSGVAVFPGLVSYAASKAALSHFTAGLRADLKGLPVRTTLVELGPVRTDMLATIDDYEPTGRSFRRMYRLRLLVDAPLDAIAADVVTAVQRGRRHVRLPKRALPFPLLTEAPRRTVELLLTGVPHRPRRPGG